MPDRSMEDQENDRIKEFDRAKDVLLTSLGDAKDAPKSLARSLTQYSEPYHDEVFDVDMLPGDVAWRFATPPVLVVIRNGKILEAKKFGDFNVDSVTVPEEGADIHATSAESTPENMSTADLFTLAERVNWLAGEDVPDAPKKKYEIKGVEDMDDKGIGHTEI